VVNEILRAQVTLIVVRYAQLEVSRNNVPCQEAPLALTTMNQMASGSNASSRAITPPRSSSAADPDTLLTPEQVRQIEINRLRAKAKQRLREEELATSSSSLNSNNKRPVSSNNVITTSPTAPGKQKPLARGSMLGKYFDYDLSKMVNSKGGFLVDDDKEVDEGMRMKEKERERQRAMHNLEPRKSHSREQSNDELT
jgi:DNA-repair protein complementing XP-A cells